MAFQRVQGEHQPKRCSTPWTPTSKLREELRDDIVILAALMERLMNTALLYGPSALINYVETLIQTAVTRGGAEGDAKKDEAQAAGAST